jgi:hypothetical protein
LSGQLERKGFAAVAMADLAGGRPAAMEDESGDNAEHLGGAQAGASAGSEGGDEEPSGVAESGKGSSVGNDRSAGEFAATTSFAGVFPAKFSSFPSSVAPASAPRPVPSLFPSSGNVSNSCAPWFSARFSSLYLI